MRLRIVACSVLTLSMLGTLAACSSSGARPNPASASSASCPAPGAKPVSSAGSAIDLAAIAKDVGTTGPTVPGDPGRQVIVMQERHDSRAAQVEIAIMLERLYQDHGLRDLALEGAVVEKGDPTPGWFYKLPDACARTEVALYLLRQGEIGGAEFMAMAHPDFHLHAIEVSSQYSVTESPAEQQAVPAYVNALGKESGTAEQAQRFNHLLSLLAPADGSTPPVEIMPQVIDGLVGLAREFNLNMGGAAQAIQQDRAFWLAAAQRTATMADRTIAALSHAPGGLIVLDIGAAHTRGVLGLMQQRSVSTAVLSPVSLSADQQHGDLTQAEYGRKQEGHLVGPPGTLGALLEQRHRPAPPFGNAAFDAESAIMYAAEQAVQAAAGGSGGPGWPPDDTTLGLGPFNPIDIPKGLISIVHRKPPEVSMQVRVKATGQTFWMAAWQVPSETPIAKDEKTVLEALFAILKAIRAEPAPRNTPEPPATAVAVRLGSEVMGVFATDKDAAIKAARAAMASS